MLPWTKKYEPVKLSEIIGQDKAVNELKDYVINYKNKKKKAMLLYGPSGVGKTSSVLALAKEIGTELIEVNASDYRTEEQINSKVGSAAKQQSLFSKGKIILIDEIDGLAGNNDRGGLKALNKIIDETAFPIILTATNPWESKFSALRNKSEMTQFHHLNYLSIAKLLLQICKQEKIHCDEESIKTLAHRAGGDMRAAIADLQTISIEKEINKESIDLLSEREREETIINALLKVFKTTDIKLAITAFDNVREDLNQQFLWLDENLPNEYSKPIDLFRAYDAMSRADVFNGRISRWQHWRFMVYINALMTAGVAASKDEKYSKFIQYKPTGRILKLWWAKQKSMKKKAIAQKVASHTHASVKDTIKSTLPYLQVIFKKNKTMANQIAVELKLDREEIEWLRK